jgi:hypothetical protein
MISPEQIQAILAQYEKHGWLLRRVLLSAEMRNLLPDALFKQAEIVASDLNALWFSRASFNGSETWEIRLLGGAPFALVEIFEADDEEEVREEARQEMQTRLLEQASKFGNKKFAG